MTSIGKNCYTDRLVIDDDIILKSLPPNKFIKSGEGGKIIYTEENPIMMGPNNTISGQITFSETINGNINGNAATTSKLTNKLNIGTNLTLASGEDEFDASSEDTINLDLDLSSYARKDQANNFFGTQRFVQKIVGNIDTANKLKNTRNIGGISFDGSANIDLPGVNTAGNQNTSGNSSTATTLQTARNIGGISFDGSTDINLPGVNTVGNQDTTGNSATATNIPYSGLTGTVPTWNQNTTGTAENSNHTPYSGLTGTVPTWNQNTTGNASTATALQSGNQIINGDLQVNGLKIRDPEEDDNNLLEIYGTDTSTETNAFISCSSQQGKLQKLSISMEDNVVAQFTNNRTNYTINNKGLSISSSGIPIQLGTYNISTGTVETGTQVLFHFNSSDTQRVLFKNNGSGSQYLKLQNSEGAFGLGIDGGSFFIYDYDNSDVRMEINSSGQLSCECLNITGQAGAGVILTPLSLMNFGAGGTSGGLYSFGGLSSSSLSIDTTATDKHQITSSTGNIDFGNENLSTTGDISNGTISIVNDHINSTTGEIDFGNELLITMGQVKLYGGIMGHYSNVDTDSVYKYYNYTAGYSNIVKNYGNSTHNSMVMIHGRDNITGVSYGFVGMYDSTNNLVFSQPAGHQTTNSAIFGAGHHINSASSITTNGLGTSIGYSPHNVCNGLLVSGSGNSIANSANSIIGGTRNYTALLNPQMINDVGNKGFYNSIMVGDLIGRYGPITAHACAFFGKQHHTSDKTLSSPRSGGLFVPKEVKYCIAAGYNHTFKHDYCSLFGSGQASSASGQLRNSGEIYAQNGVVNSSDRRIKKDIIDCNPDVSVNIIKELKVRKYKYTDKYREALLDVPSPDFVTGCIAQEVEEIYPECIKTEQKNFYAPDNDSETELLLSFENFKSIDKQKLIWPLIQSVQVLMKQVETLQNEIKILQENKE